MANDIIRRGAGIKQANSRDRGALSGARCAWSCAFRSTPTFR